ncbi:MAG: MFS transporter [Opitutales bacterium]
MLKRWAPPAAAPAPEVPPEVRRHLRRNYLSHCLDGGLFIGGVAFVAPDTLIPPLLEELGTPGFFVALSPSLMLLGFMLTPLLVAHVVEGKRQVYNLVVGAGFFQRLPYLLAALALFAAGLFPNWMVQAAIILAPFVSGLVGGFAATAWIQLIAKALPPHRRASASAIRNTIGAALGFAAGLVTKGLLEAMPGTTGYAWLHLIAYVLLMASLAVIARIREPDTAAETPPKRDFVQNLRSIPQILREDRQYRRFMLSIACSQGFLIMVPWMAIHARTTLDAPLQFLGTLLAAKSLGIFAGNFAAAFLGDNFGGKTVFIVAYSAWLLVAVVALLATSELGFILMFGLFGMGFTMNMVGRQTLALELAAPNRLPTYIALLMSGVAPFMLASAGLATAAKGISDALGGAFWPIALPAFVSTAAALAFMLKVREPRYAEGSENAA